MADNFTWDDYRYELVPLGNLFVDKEYQRRPTTLIKEIGMDFKPPLVGTLAVSGRKESGRGDTRRVTSGAAFDGQQRLGGARLWNENIKKGEVEGRPVVVIPCVVYSGLSRADEAQLFAWLQMKRRGVASYDRFRAALIAGDEESLDIRQIAEESGYEVGYSGQSPDTISAVAALEHIYRNKRQGPVVLERTLVVFKEAWKQNYIPSSNHLRGMARFLADNPEIDDERLIRRMFITSPTDLEKRAISAREVQGGSLATDRAWAEAIRAVYSIRQQQVDRKTAAA